MSEHELRLEIERLRLLLDETVTVLDGTKHALADLVVNHQEWDYHPAVIAAENMLGRCVNAQIADARREPHSERSRQLMANWII